MASCEFDYHSRRWLRVREQALKTYGYKCQESLRYGLIRQADVVHHIWPVEDFPEYAWESWNHLPLTRENHDRMHNRITGRLTPLGEAWRRRCPPLKKSTP